MGTPRELAKSAFLAGFNAVARWVIDRVPLRRALNTDNFIRLAYRLLLDRAPDPGGFDHHRRHILGRKLDKSFVFQALATSPEYEKGQDARHFARRRLVARLPAADVIVDLGGSSPHADEGALHAMGYPHRWRRMVIVDLPPAERYIEWRKSGGEPMRVATDRGPVEYAYGSIADPGVIAESAFADLVWSGNSIEHVSEEEGDRMLELAWRVLKPGGQLCLDTPNRRVTRVLHPDSLCNPDHRIEYEHATLAAKLRARGFVIEEAFGVLDGREIVASGRFDRAAQTACPEFTPVIEDGYFLYYRCRRP